MHIAACATALLGACCLALVPGRRSAPALAAASLMVVAMLDMATGLLGMHSAVWAGTCAFAAFVWAAGTRIRRSQPQLHSQLGLLLMAGCAAVMGSGGSGHGGGAAGGHAGHSGAPASTLTFLVLAGAAAYLVYSVAEIRALGAASRHARPSIRSRLTAVEVGAMGVSGVFMTAALL